jgi:hypothetical protein
MISKPLSPVTPMLMVAFVLEVLLIQRGHQLDEQRQRQQDDQEPSERIGRRPGKMQMQHAVAGSQSAGQAHLCPLKIRPAATAIVRVGIVLTEF